MCCSFWEKCKNSPKTGLGCSTPLNSKIGESGRKLEKRLAEHKSEATSSKSAIREKAERSKGHNINWENVKVLEREPRDFSMKILEAIHIKTLNPAR